MVLGVAVLLDVAVLPLLYACFFVPGLCETFFDNASQTILPGVVAREDMEKANGRLEGARIVANDLASPPVGSALFALVAAIPFLLNAGAFAASAALVLAGRATEASSGRCDLWDWHRPLVVCQEGNTQVRRFDPERRVTRKMLPDGGLVMCVRGRAGEC